MIRRLLDRFRAWSESGKEQVLDPSVRLLELDGFRPEGFERGIEVLNDQKTPMDFVVDALVRHGGLTKQTAVQAMLLIHTRGGALLPMTTDDAARDAAAAITAEARAKNYPLVCRAVSVSKTV